MLKINQPNQKRFPISQLSEVEKKNLVSLMIREIVFTKEKIKIEFYEVPEIEKKIKKGPTDSFAEPLLRLPEMDSNHMS